MKLTGPQFENARRPFFNFTPRCENFPLGPWSYPPGVKLSTRGEDPLFASSFYSPKHYIESVHPWEWMKEWTIPLGTKFTPGLESSPLGDKVHFLGAKFIPRGELPPWPLGAPRDLCHPIYTGKLLDNAYKLSICNQEFLNDYAYPSWPKTPDVLIRSFN
jgi:hypothetical protein